MTIYLSSLDFDNDLSKYIRNAKSFFFKFVIQLCHAHARHYRESSGAITKMMVNGNVNNGIVMVVGFPWFGKEMVLIIFIKE